MYIIETRHFKDEHTNTVLVCTPERVLIQRRDPDDAILEEWFIPFHKVEEVETAIELSEKKLNFIRKDYFVIVHKNFFETQDVVIRFEPMEFAIWDTFTGDPTCFIRVPLELPEFEDDTVIITSDQKFFVAEKNITHIFQVLKSFSSGSVEVVSVYLTQILEKHKGKVCKLFVQKDNPLCFEFCDGYRVFLAPVIWT